MITKRGHLRRILCRVNSCQVLTLVNSKHNKNINNLTVILHTFFLGH